MGPKWPEMALLSEPIFMRKNVINCLFVIFSPFYWVGLIEFVIRGLGGGGGPWALSDFEKIALSPER